MRPRLALLIAVLALWAFPAAAHRPSDAYLSLKIEGAAVTGQWDIALRDLDHAIGLDGDGDGRLTWGEVRRRHDAIAAYALSRLALSGDGAGCATAVTEQLIERHGEDPYGSLTLSATCPRAIGSLAVDYRLLFDLDPLHRGLIQVVRDGRTFATVLGPDSPVWRIAPGGPGLWQRLAGFLWEGVWHIWIGFDHILFLLTLLLPAVQHWRHGTWQPVEGLPQTLREVAKVVTAFTLAHSLTLGLATLGWFDPPGWLVEPLIAGSIVVAALNNIWPIVTRRIWLVALFFGLLHGFGFAGALADLGLPDDALLIALLGFNLGVEAGQMVLVAAFLPLAFWARRHWVYRRLALPLGSGFIALLGGLWIVERTFEWQLLS